MSTLTEKRIVEMEFDNAEFEKNIQTSMKSLNELDKQLGNDIDSKSIDQMSNALGRASNGFRELTYSTSDAVMSFVEFKILGTSIESVVTDIIHSATGLVKALTIDPVKTGFSEYETYINAFQTIMAGTRKEFGLTSGVLSEDERLEKTNEQLQAITKTLDDLNEYADNTIYNFTQMTDSIGKFTNAGVQLQPAATAIKGISNLAAMAGADSAANNRAMYNIAQALGVGKMMNRDWISIENAQMGTQEFKDLLIAVAKRQGQDTGAVLGKEGQVVTPAAVDDFRSSLASGWLTNDVLLEALDVLGGWDPDEQKQIDFINKLSSLGYNTEQVEYFKDLAKTAYDASTKVKTVSQLIDTLKEAAQSGWTESWRYIIGDLNQAKITLTTIKSYFEDIISANANRRNTMLKEWAEGGGRAALENSLIILLNIIKELSGSIKGGIASVFAPLTGGKLINVSKGLESLVTKFQDFLNTGEGEVFKETLQDIGQALAVVARFKIDKFAFRFKVIYKVAKALSPILTMAFDIFGGISKIIDGIWSTIDGSIGVLSDESSILSTIYKKLISLRSKVKEIVDTVVTWFDGIFVRVKTEGWKAVGYDLIAGLWNGIKTGAVYLWTVVKNVFNGLIDQVKNILGIHSPSKVMEEIGEQTMEGYGLGISEKLAYVGSKIINAIQRIVEKFQTLWGWFSNSAFGSRIINVTVALWKVVRRVFLDVWGFLEELVKKGADTNIFALILGIFKQAIKNVYNGFVDILDTFAKSFNKIMGSLNFSSLLKTGLVEILVGLIPLIVTIHRIGAAAKGIKNVFFDLAASFAKLVGRDGDSIATPQKKFLEVSEGIVLIAASVAIVAKSIIELSELDWGSFFNGLAKMIIASAALAGVAFMFRSSSAAASSFKTLGMNLVLLVAAVWVISKLSPGAIVKGIINLSLLTLLMKLLGNITNGIKKNGDADWKGLLAAGVSLFIMVQSLKSLAKLDTYSLIKGLAGMAVFILEIKMLMSSANGFKASGLVALGFSLLAFVAAIGWMGSMDISTLIKGILSIKLAMESFTKVIGMGSKLSKGSGLASLLIIAGMMFSFYLVIKEITSMPMGDVGKIVGVIGAIGLAMNGLGTILKSVSTFGKIGFIKTLEGLGGFVVVLAAMVGVAYGMVKLFDAVKGDDDGERMLHNLSRTAEFAQKLGAIAGRLIGGLLGGVATGALAELPAQAQYMGDFLTTLKTSGFMSAAKDLDDSSITAASKLANVLTSWAYADLKVGFLDIFKKGNYIENNKESILAVGDILTEFSGRIEPLGRGDALSRMERASSVALELTNVLKNMPYRSLFSRLEGVPDTESFKTNIETLITVLNDFSTTVGENFNDADVIERMNNAVKIAGKLSDLANKLPKTGGWFQDIVGAQDLQSFALAIPDLASGLDAFAKAVNDNNISKMDKDKSDKILETAESIATLSKHVSAVNESIKIGGGYIFGLNFSVDITKTNLEKFAGYLKPLAEGMDAYAEEINKTDVSAIETGKSDALVAAAGSVAELQSKLTKTDGLWQVFAGEKDLGKFSEQIRTFGENIVAFANTILAFNTDAEGNEVTFEEADYKWALTAAEGIADFVSILDEKGLDSTKLNSANQIVSLNAFSETIPDFGNGLRAYNQAIAGFASGENGMANPADVLFSNLTVGYLSTLVDALKNWANYKDANGIDPLTDFGKSMPGFGDNLMLYSTKIKGFANASEEDDRTGVVTQLAGLSSLVTALNDSQYNNYKSANDIDPLTAFGNNFESFAQSLMTYSTKVNGFSTASKPEDRQGAIDTFTSLGTLAATLEGGTGYSSAAQVRQLFETNPLGDFAKGMIGLSFALRVYSACVHGFDETVDAEDRQALEETYDSLGEFADEIYKIQKEHEDPRDILEKIIFGDEDKTLTEFGEGLGSLGGALGKYAEGVKDFASKSTPEDREAAIAVVRDLNTLIEEIYSVDENGNTTYGVLEDYGRFQRLTDTLSQFGTDYNQYATQVIAVFDSANSIMDATAQAQAQLKAFVNFVENKDGNGLDIDGFVTGVAGWFVTDKYEEAEGAAEKMAAIGIYIASFAEHVGKAKSRIIAFSDFQTLVKDLETFIDENGLGSLSDIVDEVDDLTGDLSVLGRAVSSFYIAMAEGLIDDDDAALLANKEETALSSAANILDTLLGFAKLSTEEMDNLNAFFQNDDESLLTTVLNTLSDASGSFTALSENMANALNPENNGTYDLWFDAGFKAAEAFRNGFSSSGGVSVTDLFDNLFTYFDTKFGGLLSAIADSISLAGLYSGVKNTLVSAMGDGTESVEQSLLTEIVNTYNDLAELNTSLGGKLVSLIADPAKALKEYEKELIPAVEDLVKAVVQSIGPAVRNSISEETLSTFDAIKNNLIGLLSDPTGTIVKYIREIVPKVTPIITFYAAKLMTSLAYITASIIADVYDSAGKYGLDRIQSLLAAVIQFAEAPAEFLGAWMDKNLITISEKIAQFIQNIIESTADSLAQSYGTSLEAVANFLKSPEQSIITSVTNIIEAITDAVNQSVTSIITNAYQTLDVISGGWFGAVISERAQALGITPVVSWDDKSPRLSGRIDDRESRYALNPDLTARLAREADATHVDYTGQLNTIISEITTLNGNISSLGESIGGMSITLDTGALVGHLTGPINRALGLNYLRLARRGN